MGTESSSLQQYSSPLERSIPLSPTEPLPTSSPSSLTCSSNFSSTIGGVVNGRSLISDSIEIFPIFRYFFPHTVLSHMEGEGVGGVMDHREDFFTIMQVGQREVPNSLCFIFCSLV